jgi:hypothetical protein
MTKRKDLAYLPGQMEENMRDSGKKINIMERELYTKEINQKKVNGNMAS